MIGYENYVCGTRFRDLAHHILNKDMSITTVGMPDEGKYHIYYCHTHDINMWFAYFNSFFENDKIWNDGWESIKLVLITHNSDGSVRNSKDGQEIREHDADASLLPPNIVKWYAQNVECDLRTNPKVVPIPIGLENRYCFDYDKAEMLFNKKDRFSTKHYYLNCNLYTNFPERSCALNACQRNSDIVTIRLCQNGHDYDRYLEDILDHKYIVSPRGNGLDCHRTYEALYLNRIPVMKVIPSLTTFELPIWWVEDWNDFPDNAWWLANHKLQALDMNYWKKRIEHAQ